VARACGQAGDDVAAPARAALDLLDAASVRERVAAVRPQAIYHLAAIAHVGDSWKEPERVLRDNLVMTLHLLEAVRAEAPEAIVVIVGSSEQYGPPDQLPVDEGAPLRPQNPYAVSKACTDLLAGQYADAHGLHVVRPRAFNHAGPGQLPSYAIASFARQVAAGLERGEDPVRVVSGNPDAGRDYTDVRDVARAYRLLAAAGEPGIYNVCSGRTTTAGELVRMLGEEAGVGIEHVVDQRLVRAHEVLEVRGSHERLTRTTGWEARTPLRQTLADTVRWWREQIRAGRG